METRATLVLPKLHDKQRMIKRGATRFNVLACGRRFGKDILGHELAVDTLLDGKPVGWFAPTYRMMLDTYKDMARILKPISTRVNASDHRIEVVTGGVLDMWSLDTPDVARGRKYARVVVNEAAMVADLGSAWNEVIRPTLADYAGDGFFLSTPRGRNEFWRMYQRGANTEQGWRAWSFPTYANPHIKATEVDALKGDMPERSYLQEIEAQFIEDGAGVFRGVRAAATAEVWDKWREGAQIVGGLDWALSNDYTVLTLVDAASMQVVHIDRFNGVDYSLQRQRIAATCARYQVSALIAEANAMGKPNNDELRRAGVRARDFTTTNTTKADAIESLAASFEQGRIRIPSDETLLMELESFEAERTASGMMRYSAPSGSHDDMVMSLALAWTAVSNRADPVSYGWQR